MDLLASARLVCSRPCVLFRGTTYLSARVRLPLASSQPICWRRDWPRTD